MKHTIVLLHNLVALQELEFNVAPLKMGLKFLSVERKIYLTNEKENDLLSFC